MKILLNNHRCDSLTESVQDNVVKSVWNDSIDVGERGEVVFNTFHRTALLLTDEEYAMYKEGVFSEKIKLILWQLGMLVSPHRDERKEWCQLYVEHKKAMSYIDLTVLLTQRCQMRCVYCFEGDKGKHDIQTETTDDILRFLATKTDECRRIRVTWFGGEPLIAYNRMAELSRRLIGFCTANAIEYSADMTTNAYSLDDRKCHELCKELHVGRFIVTLDGTKTVHNKRRPHVSGVSSFERIWHNICTLVSEGAFVTIRMTIDKDNADNIPQLLDHIASSELYGKVGISFCRTVAINFTPQSVLDSLYSESEFAEVEWKLIEYAHRLGMWRYQFPYAAPLGGCLRDGDIVIGTDGEVYKCTDTIGDNRWITGHIAPDKNDMTPTPAWYAEWKNWTPLDNPKCMDCVLMPLCNGGCPHNALFADKKHGSESACPDWKANYRRQIKSLVDEEYT